MRESEKEDIGWILFVRDEAIVEERTLVVFEVNCWMVKERIPLPIEQDEEG